MSNSIKIEVRQDHIDDGELESATCCAIALACEDSLLKHFKGKWNKDYGMYVDMNGYIDVMDNKNNKTAYSIELNDDAHLKVYEFIDNFDNQNEYFDNQKDIDECLQPFEFKGELKCRI
tara:strand:- start:67 stop:423 length:357 start_codon:yes stop_codon:yes gene_type:complete